MFVSINMTLQPNLQAKEMELSLVGLQNSGKTSLVNVVAVSILCFHFDNLFNTYMMVVGDIMMSFYLFRLVNTVKT